MKEMTSRKGTVPIILIAVIALALVLAVGGVGIGLAWKTEYLDRWLPANVKEFFGRGVVSEVEEPEEAGEKIEYLVFEKGGLRALSVAETGGGVLPLPGVKVPPQQLYLISKDGKERKMLIEFKPKEYVTYYWVVGNRIYYQLKDYGITEGTIEVTVPVAMVDSTGVTQNLDFIIMPEENDHYSISIHFMVSPDGRKVIWHCRFYCMDGKTGEQLWLADIDGENKKMVLERIKEWRYDPPFSFYLQKWSKDSSFVYLIEGGAGRGFFKLSLDTGQVADILAKNEFFEDISPDEDLVAYVEREEEEEALGLFHFSHELPLIIKDIATGEKVFVTKSPKERNPQEPGIIARVKFSPGGEFLFYDIRRDIQHDLFLIIDIEKREEELITDIPDWAKEEDYSDLAGEEYRFIGKMELSAGEF